jgi:hypothetical protein
MTFTSPSGRGVRGRQQIKASNEGPTQRLLVLLSGHQRPSATIGGRRQPAATIGSHQRPATAIGGRQRIGRRRASYSYRRACARRAEADIETGSFRYQACVVP